MRKIRLYQRMLGCLLGMQLFCYLPVYAEGTFTDNGRPADKHSTAFAPITGTITDNTGKPMYNQTLSEQRANNVAQYLISQQINPNRFAIRGYGERNPVASNNTVLGRTANRRVEITLHAI